MSTRRDFITLLGGATAAWPVPVRAQSLHRIGFLGGRGLKKSIFFGGQAAGMQFPRLVAAKPICFRAQCGFSKSFILRISMGSCLWTIEW